jgi:hypothetical protein
VQITKQRREKAVRSNSGGCLIADAIKETYPALTGVSVDMATVRVSDRKMGVRFIYLTPPAAQQMLLSFDQGWEPTVENLTIRRAVQIVPIVKARSDRGGRKQREAARSKRLKELQERKVKGTLTSDERRSLTRMLNANRTPKRPSSYGVPRIETMPDRKGVVVIGGAPLPQGPSHPNLLRGSNRHFGAKLADPGEAFAKAVDAEIAARVRSGNMQLTESESRD